MAHDSHADHMKTAIQKALDAAAGKQGHIPLTLLISLISRCNTILTDKSRTSAAKSDAEMKAELATASAIVEIVSKGETTTAEAFQQVADANADFRSMILLLLKVRDAVVDLARLQEIGVTPFLVSFKGAPADVVQRVFTLKNAMAAHAAELGDAAAVAAWDKILDDASAKLPGIIDTLMKARDAKRKNEAKREAHAACEQLA